MFLLLRSNDFKRKQDPYFCCNENSEKIISSVDTAYLRKWLKTKKLQRTRAWKFFSGNTGEILHNFATADTTLIETYNRFNKAVKNKILPAVHLPKIIFSN